MKSHTKRYFLLVLAQTACLALGLWLGKPLRTVRFRVGRKLVANRRYGTQYAGPGNGRVAPVWAIRAMAFVWIAALQAVVAYLVLSRAQEATRRKQNRAERVSMERHSELLRTRDAVIFGLAKLAESRDADTGYHLERIALYSTRLAAALRRNPQFRRQVTPQFLKLIGISASLHDIGKVGISDSVLLKPGKFESHERHAMNLHAAIGGKCIRDIESRLGKSNFLQMAREIAFAHHEWWDGTGYPRGLAGEEIPLAARIVAVADVYDAACCLEASLQGMPWPTSNAWPRSKRCGARNLIRPLSRHFWKSNASFLKYLSVTARPWRRTPNNLIVRGRPNMHRKKQQNQIGLELVLIFVCLALCFILHKVGCYRMVVLDLFYLPVVLAAFFLGRYHAGVLAVLAVVCAAVVMAVDLDTHAAFTSPLAIGLALSTWASAMGIISIFVGTVSDERNAKIEELHDAYLGVVEVLARYLNSADPRLGDRATKVAEISQKVASQLRLSDKEIDDIRVAALLQDIDNMEVTARVIRKAVGDVVQFNRSNRLETTFNGSDLVQSLGSVLTGALPMLVKSDDAFALDDADESGVGFGSGLGGHIIRTVKSCVTLLSQDHGMTEPAGSDQRLGSRYGARSSPGSHACIEANRGAAA